MGTLLVLPSQLNTGKAHNLRERATEVRRIVNLADWAPRGAVFKLELDEPSLVTLGREVGIIRQCPGTS